MHINFMLYCPIIMEITIFILENPRVGSFSIFHCAVIYYNLDSDKVVYEHIIEM